MPAFLSLLIITPCNALSASNTLGHVGSDLMGEAESHQPCCACASEEKPRATDGPTYGRDFNTHTMLCMRTKGNNEIDQYQFLALCCIASASIHSDSSADASSMALVSLHTATAIFVLYINPISVRLT